MTTSSERVATPALLRQHVRDVRAGMRNRTHPEPFIIGIKAAPIWNHGTLEDQIAGTIHVEPCPSPLAARRAIAETLDEIAEADHEFHNLVILTDLPEAELGADLLSRFVRPKLLGLNPWDAVRQRFGVQALDPRFSDPLYAWMADLLLEVPKDSLRAGAVMLTTDSALRSVTNALFGTDGTTLEAILTATAEPTFASRIDALPPETVTALCTTLGEVLGPAGALVTGAIANGRGERCVPAGLAARTVTGQVSGSGAQARIELLTGVDTITDSALDAWASAAEHVFREIATQPDQAIVHSLDHTGSALVTDWKTPFPEASDLLSISFEKRLDQLGELLSDVLEDTDSVDVDQMRVTVKRIDDHRLAHDTADQYRARTANHAARLTAWLRSPVSDQRGTGVREDLTTPLGLTEAIRAYVADGAWVDWARRRIGPGDHSPPAFAAALARISELAHERRADGNREFSAALARWSAQGTSSDLRTNDISTIEGVLGDVVGPLAKTEPILLVVLDGCGLGPFLELADQFSRFGFREVGRNDQRQVALAALPTITSVSRTSLLTGTLTIGASNDEKRDFPKHPKIARLDGPPARVLHHHSDLDGGMGQGLPEDVRVALTADGPRALAVVINTIDDELTNGDFTPEYRLENLGPLPSLLRAAAGAGRTVIITADHGHVLGVGLDGRGQVIRSGEGGDRWRVADREPTDDEVLLKGPRVLLGGEQGILAPWHDDLRYSAKHGGYHGGATPDESIVPLAVFTPIGIDPPNGWAPLSVAPPTWWSLHVGAEKVDEPGAEPTTRRKSPKPVDPDQTALFAEPEAAEPAAAEKVGTAIVEPSATVGRDTAPPWLDAVLASTTFEVQFSLKKRARLSVDEVRATLLALHERGGVANYAVIAAAVGKPQSRIGGFLSNVADILNVDGFGVLTVKQQASEAELDELLLWQQFVGEDA